MVIIAIALLILGIVTRLIPHAPNATALTAIALVASLYLGNRLLAFIIPAVALLVSDMFIGFYDWRIVTSVYISFLLGWMLVFFSKKKNKLSTTVISLAGSSLLFFIITNTAVWWFSPWYEKNIVGLLYSYELGLPFLRNMFVGDFVYSVVLIGVFEFVYFMVHKFRNRHLSHTVISRV